MINCTDSNELQAGAPWVEPEELEFSEPPRFLRQGEKFHRAPGVDGVLTGEWMATPGHSTYSYSDTL